MAPLQTILITGCSANGIGSALAQTLADQGHHVFATARSSSKIPSSLAALSNVTVLPLDLHGAGLDVLVNNAGAGYAVPLLDVDLTQAQQVDDTDIWGPAWARWCPRRGSTLRLELAPLGVSVATLMIGTVTTPFHANEPQLILPSGSWYAAIVETISRWGTGEAGPTGCSAAELAQAIVGDVLGATGAGMFWRGPNCGAVRFVSKWAPGWLLDKMLSGGQGLDQLAAGKPSMSCLTGWDGD
ncbi:NAD(P)-binding protein [Aspergillus ellipticus CBS 707.79]|uniref:NAD(P)-binding protein n=1 Tax=Aspergillus ellipticus CBS 707.79 TaxID=1448320 RepID=A0A319DKS8_9EURO|nr:NAD(P)-binding protein [Aspergillus ellipticus CBS 707.79]